MKPKSVKFDVVQIWDNGPTIPYTIKKNKPDAVKAYAIRIGDDFFLIGTIDDYVYIDDLEVDE
jgi:hypothetical protein